LPSASALFSGQSLKKTDPCCCSRFPISTRKPLLEQEPFASLEPGAFKSGHYAVIERWQVMVEGVVLKPGRLTAPRIDSMVLFS
jgi:hypothetical protein